MTGLLTAEIRRRLPNIYATEREANPTVHAKFFTPWSSWTWFVIEFDGEDTCFGLVDGFEAELGYFSLSELESIRGPGGIRIERDHYFKPTDLKSIRSGMDARKNSGHLTEHHR